MSITIKSLIKGVTTTYRDEEGRSIDPSEVRLESQAELYAFHNNMCDDAAILMQKKNTDYAGGTPSIFGNLDACETLGLCTTENGILIRMLDKQTRIANVLKAGQSAITDETIIDNLIDIINYSVLLAAKMTHRQLQTMKAPTNEPK